MEAISRLIRSGMTRKQIALTLEVSEQAIGMLHRGQRFPGRKLYVAIVGLAESRGLCLLAKDFIKESI
jgi:hypothetical protein